MYADPSGLEIPRWSRRAPRRLLVSLALSTICVATMLLVLRFPVALQAPPLSKLLLHILIEEAESIVPPEIAENVAEPIAEPLNQAPAAPVDAETVEPPAARADWYARIPEAVAAALDNVPEKYSVNPLFEEKRRRAAQQFYPSRAPVAQPTWEKVEKDAMGRSVLWSGDCYRVVDDPNAGSREAFETFGQYITYCMNWQERPKELPWVSEIRNRRASQARYAPRVAE